jgi:hypothetical protein
LDSSTTFLHASFEITASQRLMSIDKRKLIPRPAFLSQLEELLSSLEENWHVVSVVAGQRRLRVLIAKLVWKVFFCVLARSS